MAAPPVDVVCVGHAIVDVLSHQTEAFLTEHDLVKGTMRLIDEAEAERLYASTGPAEEVSGGSAANTAVGVAGLGGLARFLGRVRDDQLGDVFVHDVRAAGVSYDVAPARSGAATGRSLVLVTPDGERTMNTFLGAGAQLSTDDVDLDAAAAAGILYVEGFLWDSPSARAAATAAIDRSREAGRRVAFTLSDPFAVERHLDEFAALVRDRVDVLFANGDEVMALCGGTVDEAIDAVALEVDVACVTRGAEGSVIVAGGERCAVPADPADVVDTTGAGDQYAAGVLFGLARGLPHEVCARLGSLAAAEVISHVGARPVVDLAALATAAGIL